MSTVLRPLCGRQSSAPGQFSKPNPSVLMEPTKPLNDVNRQYRYIELGNDIAVTLVSDPTAKMAAAALDVAIGSFNDPEDLQGLAHFLEHMLFMGSEKYPEENAYERYLTEHGGYSNAFTTETHTCYHFEVDAQHLEKALDIFASIFVSPRMDPSTTERELMSVHSEDKKSEKQDSWRIAQVLNACSNQNHPIAKFIGGNKTSLDTEPRAKGISVRERLLEFHDKYYSSNLMRLCIAGSQSLDLLEKWTRNTFSSIVNKKIPLPNHPTDPMLPGKPLGNEIFIASVKNKRKIVMNWLMPSYKDHHTEGALEYFTQLLGHEGTGSLFALLKRRGWASELMASYDDSVSSYTIFEVEIPLTVDGFRNHRYDVVRLTYEYLDLLRREGPQEHIFKELAMINKIDFDNMNQSAFGSLVVTLAGNMWLYPVKDILRGPWAYDQYNPELIKKTLSYFRLDNMFLTHVSKEFDSITLDQTERWYGVKYHMRPIDASLELDKVPSPSTLFHLPAANPFIPTELLVHPMPKPVQSPRALSNGEGPIGDSKIKAHNTAKASSTIDEPHLWAEPECIVDDPKCKAWHLQDPMFATSPKLSVRLLIHSAQAYTTAHDHICTSQYVSFVLDSLNEYAYTATLAGIDYSVSSVFEGIFISISGYAEKIPLFTEKVLECLMTVSMKEDRFKIQKQEDMKDFSNFGRGQPHLQADEYLDTLTLLPRWPMIEKHIACSKVELDDVIHHKKLFLRHCKLEWLLHGNITRQGALDLISIGNHLFESSAALLPSQLLVQRTIQLPERKTVRFERAGLDSENPNAATFVWYQLGSFYNLEESTIMKVGSTLLEEKIYDTLRTKEQLGYLIFSGSRSQYASNGYRIAVQSSEYSASYLLSRIDALVQKTIPEYLDSMSDEVFQGFLDSCVTASSERPTTLGKRTRSIWSAVEDGSYEFLRNRKCTEIMKTLTKSKVLDFVRSIFTDHARIAILITTPHLKEEPAELTKDDLVVHNVTAFRNAMHLLPVPVNGDFHLPEMPIEIPEDMEGDGDDEEEEEDEEDEEYEEDEEGHEEEEEDEDDEDEEAEEE